MFTRISILIVEDDPGQSAEYVRSFEAEGHRACAAVSAEEAIRLIETTRYDLILSDNILPGMSGLRAIREFSSRSAVPVFIMTSHYCPEGAQDARLLGAAAYLRKPLDIKDVLLRLWKRCTVFEAVNETLREFYVGLSVRPLTAADIASQCGEMPPAAIAHWRKEHRVRYCCVDGGLTGPDSEAYVCGYAERLSRPEWKALMGGD